MERAHRMPWEMSELHIAADLLSNGYLVSTVSRPPMLRDLDGMIGLLGGLIDPDNEMGRADLTTPGDYETMVFEADVEAKEVLSWTALDFRRYVTEQEALVGHEAVISDWLVKS